MGCDIHLMVEVRKNSVWTEATCVRACYECKGVLKNYKDEEVECWDCSGNGREAGFNSRNYDTFAVLANVRNGYGFAGVPTGDWIQPISEPRGLPNDMSEATRLAASEEDFDAYGWLGDHSHSWLTLAELLDYNWKATRTKTGVLSMEEFAKWDAKGGGWPSSWSGDVSGGGVLHISQETMRGLINDSYLDQQRKVMETAKNFGWGFMDNEGKFPRFYTRVEWQDTIANCCREFHDSFIPALENLGPPDDVRIVFGFDN